MFPVKQLFILTTLLIGVISTRHIKFPNESYNPGKSTISNLFQSPLFPNGTNDALKRQFPSIPTLAFALYQEGLSFDGSRWPRLSERAAESQEPLNKYIAPLTVGNVTKPAIFWAQEVVKFDSFDDFSKLAFTIEALQDPAQQPLIQESIQIFTNSTIAEETFMSSLLQVYAMNGLMALKKVTRKMADGYVGSVFTDFDLKSCSCHKYYVLDTEAIGAVKPYSPNTTVARYSVGSLTLLEKRDDGKLIPVAVKITMFPDRDPNSLPNVRIFSSSKSTPSAWRLALIAARSSYTQWGISSGHLLAYHVSLGAFQQAYYNSFEPAHPLREMFDPFSKYNMQVLNWILLNITPIPAFPFYNDAPNLENFVGVMKTWDGMYASLDAFTDLRPSKFLKKQNVKERDFSENEAWDQLRAADHFIQTEKISKRFARQVINSIYKSNCDVRRDIQLQNFVEACIKNGNLKKLSSSGKIRNKQELIEVFSTYLYLLLSHSYARVEVFNTGMTLAPMTIPSLNSNEFMYKDDKTYNFSDQELLNHMPPSNILAQYLGFNLFFSETTPYEKLSDTEIYDKSTEVGREHNYLLKKYADDVREMIISELEQDGFEPDEEMVEKFMDKIPRNCES